MSEERLVAKRPVRRQINWGEILESTCGSRREDAGCFPKYFWGSRLCGLHAALSFIKLYIPVPSIMASVQWEFSKRLLE